MNSISISGNRSDNRKNKKPAIAIPGVLKRSLAWALTLCMVLTLVTTATVYAGDPPSNYHRGDVAVINAIIDNNGLSWTRNAPETWREELVYWVNGRITHLYIDYLGLTGALDLTGLEELRELDFQDNKIESLDIRGLTNLTHIWGNDNQLTTLDLRGLPRLVALEVQDNRLTRLDLAGNTRLEVLNCAGNELTSLYLNDSPGLSVLQAQNNRLAALDLSGNPLLTQLDVSGNMLTALDVRDNPLLTELNVSGNMLTELNVSNNPALAELTAADNMLTTLTLGNLPALTVLSAEGNRLTALVLSELPKLAELYLQGNMLETLDVSDLPMLETLNANNNKLTSLALRNTDPTVPYEHIDVRYNFFDEPGTQITGRADSFWGDGAAQEQLPFAHKPDKSWDTVLTAINISGVDYVNLAGLSTPPGARVFNIADGGNFTLMGDGTLIDNVAFIFGNNNTVTIDNLNIKSAHNHTDATAMPQTGHAPLNFTGTNNTLILKGNNTVTSGQTSAATGYGAAVGVPQGASLTITGRGTLTADAGTDGAAIGGGQGTNAGNITISGGTIRTIGTGIGIGCGDGIVAGNDNIIINGGSIMGGVQAPKNTIGLDALRVYHTTVTIPGAININVNVQRIEFNGAEYGTGGEQTDGEGKLYLHLPLSDIVPDDWKDTIRVTINGITYVGEFELENNYDNTVTLDKIDINSARITVASAVYNGGAHEPNLTVTLGGDRSRGILPIELTKGEDYQIVSWADNINAGHSARVTIRGIGNEFTGETVRFFTINRARPAAMTLPTASPVRQGQTLADSVLTPVSNNYGNFAWEDSTLVPTTGNIGYFVVFTPNELGNRNFENIPNQRIMVTVLTAPVAAPANRTFSNSVSITLSSATAGATIYYTVDGSTPTTASTLYTGAFTRTETTTVRAIAVLDGIVSDVMTVTFTRSSGGNGGGRNFVK